MIKCLIADKMHESLPAMLREIGVEPGYYPDCTRKEMIEMIGDFEILVIRSKTRIDEEFLIPATKLRVVARAGAGIDNLDEIALKKRNITILNAPEGNRNAVAEHTLGMLLALLNNLYKACNEVSQGIWDREGNRGWELAGKTVGIIGYGFMGMAFARKLKSMECRVIAYDKYKKSYSDDYCQESNMQDLFDQADVLSLHIPLTEETRYLVDIKFLNSFNKPIILLNTSRGEIVRLEDLLKAMDQGKIIRAGLDVLENEKLTTLTKNQQIVFERLTNNLNILLSPHVAGWTFESYVRINTILTRKLAPLISPAP